MWSEPEMGVVCIYVSVLGKEYTKILTAIISENGRIAFPLTFLSHPLLKYI